MHLPGWMRRRRTAVALLVLVLILTALSFVPALAQSTVQAPVEPAGAAQAAAGALVSTAAAAEESLPTIWYLLAAGLAMLAPAGFVLLAVANLEHKQAWNAALGGLAAAGLAAVAYWAVGFALHFGGVGLVYPNAGLHGLVLEWSPLSAEWGIGWGMAGLSGWFLTGLVSPLAYMLFLAHLPWVMLAALLPVMALRGRAPATVSLILALLLGGLVFPLAGNWVQGGGWLNALGRNMGLGHGFVDAGGAGTVHLVAAGFALAALTVWSSRRSAGGADPLPPAHQPLLAVVGALLILGGATGWLFANPLQSDGMGALGMLRGTVSVLLAASAGLVFPLIYTWFVTGSSDPTMTARGFAAGIVAGLACSPFVQPSIAVLIGLVAGASVPFVTFLLDGRLRVLDRTGVVASSGVPALIGLLLVGIFADGSVGAGWQQTGLQSYLGVTGQGVAGLTVAAGYQADFPGQVQAQVIGIAALLLWGFVTGLIVCVPLGLVYHSLLQHDAEPEAVAPLAPRPATPPPALTRSADAYAAPLARDRTTTETAIVQSLPTADPFAAAPYAYGALPAPMAPPFPPAEPMLPGPISPAPPLYAPDRPEAAPPPALPQAAFAPPEAPVELPAFAAPEVSPPAESAYVDPYAEPQPDAWSAPQASGYADPYADPEPETRPGLASAGDGDEEPEPDDADENGVNGAAAPRLTPLNRRPRGFAPPPPDNAVG